jgi:hypothetical protein
MAKKERPQEKARSERREFRVTVGLRGGYSEEGVIFDVAQATRVVERWLVDRQARNLPVVTGMMTRGEIIYARDAKAMREPVAIFSGEIQPALPTPTDDEIEAALDELAAALAEALQQEEISVAYKDQIWLVQRKASNEV